MSGPGLRLAPMPAAETPARAAGALAADAIVNALTIDVEDYFQVSAFAPHIARADWDTLPCRVERNVDAILALLSERDVKATFFCLGWVAERYPALVRRLADEGHEVASHGFAHHRATDQSPSEFQSDIERAKAVRNVRPVSRSERAKGEKLGRVQAALQAAEIQRLAQREHRRAELTKGAFIQIGVAYPGVIVRSSENSIWLLARCRSRLRSSSSILRVSLAE